MVLIVHWPKPLWPIIARSLIKGILGQSTEKSDNYQDGGHPRVIKSSGVFTVLRFQNPTTAPG